MQLGQKIGLISGECSLTIKKCKKFHVGNKDINATYIMHDQGQPVSLEHVEVEKDLGIYFASKLSFREHFTKK